jgi:hypothetical protein
MSGDLLPAPVEPATNREEIPALVARAGGGARFAEETGVGSPLWKVGLTPLVPAPSSWPGEFGNPLLAPSSCRGVWERILRFLENSPR